MYNMTNDSGVLSFDVSKNPNLRHFEGGLPQFSSLDH